MQIGIIANGSKSGAVRCGEDMLSTLRQHHHITLYTTEYKGHCREIASAIAHQSDVLICIGGDGTISECASGIADASLKHENTVCRMLPVPMGTGNDFVRSLPGEVIQTGVAERISRRDVTRCDLFRITVSHETHYFVNACSAGLGPQVVRKADKLPAFIKGNFRFQLAILFTFLGFRKKKMRLSTAEWQFENKAMAIVCANGQYFGGGIGISPESRIDDRILNITIIGNVGLFDYLKYVPALRRGEKIKHPEVHYLQCSSAELHAAAVEKDGEYVTGEAFKIDLLPFQLEII